MYNVCVSVCVSEILLKSAECVRSAQSLCSPELWSAACGRLLVRPQIADPGKTLPTLLTAEGFLPGVNPLVFFQVPCLWEVFPAGVAAERFFPRMDSLVGLQVGQAGEGLTTGLAFIAFPAVIARGDTGRLAFTVVTQEAGSLLCGNC